MVSMVLYAWSLVASTVAVHALGLALLLRSLARPGVMPPQRLWPITRKLIWVACWLILLHVAEISIWAAFYYWQGCLADAESAFYFSGVTYTTLGYGDLVLAEPWRMFGPIEGLIGILMCGLSAGFFFALVNHIYLLAQKRND